MPIFVDSPLAIDVTAVFRLHPECYDDEIRAFITSADTRLDPFGFDDLTYTRTTEESKKLNFLREPAIIIAASGMMEAGRILHHLRNRIEDPRTTVLIVGFQAENTLGRRLVDGEKEVRIFGEMLPEPRARRSPDRLQRSRRPRRTAGVGRRDGAQTEADVPRSRRADRRSSRWRSRSRRATGCRSMCRT